MTLMECGQRIAKTAADAANFDLGCAPLQGLAIRFTDGPLGAHDAGGGAASNAFAADECGDGGIVFGLRHGSKPLAHETVSVGIKLSEESKILRKIEG